VALLLCIIPLFANPVQATEVLIFGDSWAAPMEPALEAVFSEHGHPEIPVHSTEFKGLAESLSSPEGLAFITAQMNARPNVDVVHLVIGYNDVHCLLTNGVCTPKWHPNMAGSQQEALILDTIILQTEVIIDHIVSLRPTVKIFYQSYDYMRPLREIANKGTPVENNAVHDKWAERAQALANRKPAVTFLNQHGLMQLIYGFDGIAYTLFDPTTPIPPGDPSLPDPSLPSPYYPFQDQRSHMTATGYKTLAEDQYDAFYGPLLDGSGEQLGAGHSGAWFDPETSGQGLLIEVEPEDEFVFLSWFTYTDPESAHPGEQHWFTAQGNYSGFSATLPLYQTLGGRFDDSQPVNGEVVGELTLTFDDCTAGSVAYTIDDWQVQGVVPIQRLIPGSENVCKQGMEPTPQSVDINPGMDGAWYDPDTAGQGFLFDVHSDGAGGGFIFVAWFTYGDNTASGQRWLTAQGAFEGSTASIDISETTGGLFDDPQLAGTVPVGTMSIDFTDCGNAMLNYTLWDEGSDGVIELTRLLPGGTSLCEQLASEQ